MNSWTIKSLPREVPPSVDSFVYYDVLKNSEVVLSKVKADEAKSYVIRKLNISDTYQEANDFGYVKYSESAIRFCYDYAKMRLYDLFGF